MPTPAATGAQAYFAWRRGALGVPHERVFLRPIPPADRLLHNEAASPEIIPPASARRACRRASPTLDPR